MKHSSLKLKYFSQAFTLVELLTVIAIIAILAALLLPVFPRVATNALKKQARLQIDDIVTAIQKYDVDYGHFPTSNPVKNLAINSHQGQFTYGGSVLAPYAPATFPDDFTTNNSEVVAVLMNLTNTTLTDVNAKNPQQTIYLFSRLVANTNLPGVGPDLVYRDPWKNPYVITIDLNNDNQAKDAVFSLSTVSGGGLNGLIQQADGSYAYHGNVMVWSAGPDGKIDSTTLANQGVNKDNILSWGQ